MLLRMRKRALDLYDNAKMDESAMVERRTGGEQREIEGLGGRGRGRVSRIVPISAMSWAVLRSSTVW